MPQDSSPYKDRILSVAELNGIARALLETRLANLRIEGEIANLARPASGHLYFTLKDNRAQVRCAMFKNRTRGMRYQPAAGDLVVATGSISLYEPRGDYQLIVDRLEPAGAGALAAAFEALKHKLHQQGLFDEAHKKPLPAMPATIGVITSASGAALRDVLHVLNRRNPMAKVIIYPTLVQGDGAAQQIRQALLTADQRAECDVLILCRGGGSAEDLWSFNDEALARAVFDCHTPIVCGVGHEIDFSICDFVADVRAPTPSAAAELVSPDCTELAQRVAALKWQVQRLMRRRLDGQMQRLDLAGRQLQRNHPVARIERLQQRLQLQRQRLQHSISRRLQLQQRRLEFLSQRLQRRHPGNALHLATQRLTRLDHRLQQAQQMQLDALRRRLASASDKLTVMNPEHTLQRGYAIVFDQQSGRLLQSVDQVQPGQTLTTRLRDGDLHSTVEHCSKQPNANGPE